LKQPDLDAPPPPSVPASPLTTFTRKLRAAWQIFFPPPPPVVTPREEGKNRLRMILVADRCARRAAPARTASSPPAPRARTQAPRAVRPRPGAPRRAPASRRPAPRAGAA